MANYNADLKTVAVYPIQFSHSFVDDCRPTCHMTFPGPTIHYRYITFIISNEYIHIYMSIHPSDKT